MGAEMTATMIVWPKECGQGGRVLELVEHFRPYWLRRRAGRELCAVVATPACALSTGLALAGPTAHTDSAAPDLAAWAGRRVTLLRYGGCCLGDTEVEQARAAGVRLDVVDLDHEGPAQGGAR